MKRTNLSWLIGLCAALIACSGSRSERIASECVGDAQCGEGSRCEEERCVEVESASIEARGAVEGAPPGVRVEQQVVGDELCETRDAKLVCTLAPDSKVVLVAPEVAGFRFTGWSGPPVCSGSARTLELAGLRENTECTARYIRRLRVTGTTEMDGAGLVLAAAEGAFSRCEANSCEVDQGTTVTLTAPERDGFRLAGFEGAGCEDRDAYRVLVLPTQEDVTCTARYIESLTVRGQLEGVDPALAAQAGALVAASSPAPDALCEGQLCAIDPGQTVTLVAPEIAGHRFRGWVGDARCTGSAPQIDVSEVTTNVVCTADYVRRVTVRAESEGADAPLMATADEGFAQCEGAACEVDQGSTVTLLAGTVAGYRLRDWGGEGCVGGDGSRALASEVQANVVCTAHFVLGVSVSGTVVNADAAIEATSSSAGAECGSGRCTIDTGGTVTLSVPALAGRSFRGWSGDPGCSGTSLTLTLSEVAESKDCRATFAPRYQAEGRAAPAAGGRVAATASGANARCDGSACEVDEGGTVTLTAAASERFRFTGWSGGGACTGSTPSIELADLSSSVTCIANFIARIDISGTAEPAAAATIVASSRSTEAGCSGARCTVDSGADVMLRANAADGYRFTAWSGCGSPLNPLLQNNPLLVVGPTANERCTANFERITYSVVASAATGGSVTGAVDERPCDGARCTVEHGGSARFSARAAAGYSFAGWSGCVTSSEADITLEDIRESQTCRASFDRMRFAVTGVAGTGGSVVAESGDASCPNARCVVDYGARVELTASAQTGAEFIGWSGCSDSREPTLILPEVTANQTCTANFRALAYRVRAVASPAAGGSVSCADGCSVRHGEDVALTATPNGRQGYRFAGWRDCAPADDNPLAVTDVTADRTCTARFELIPVTVSGSVSPAATGTVTATSMSMGARCSGASCTVSYGDSVILTARPATGYRFARWSGATACTGANPLPLTRLDGDVRCTATFERSLSEVRFVGQSTLTSVAIDASGAACGNGICTRTVSPTDTVTVNLRFATPTSTPPGGIIPVLSGWSGCQPVSTDMTVAAPTANGSFAVTYTSTFRGFTGAATCTAQIVAGAFAIFNHPPSPAPTVETSRGWCAEVDGTNGGAHACLAPPGASVTVDSSYASWFCGFQSVASGSGRDARYPGDLEFTAVANELSGCGTEG